MSRPFWNLFLLISALAMVAFPFANHLIRSVSGARAPMQESWVKEAGTSSAPLSYRRHR